MRTRPAQARGPILVLAALCSAPATGGEPDPARVITPGMGLATDDSTASITTNPALFGFDPDAGAALQVQQRLDSSLGALQLSTSAGGLGMGLYYRSGGEAGSLWGLRSGMGLRLGEDLILGSSFCWYLPQGSDNNFTSWDLGLGYRPLSWLGFGAVARNIGSPGAAWGAVGDYGVGLALRPVGDRLVLGLDQYVSDPASLELEGLDIEPYTTQLSLRVSPIEGLELRAYGNQHLELGAGLRVNFGGTAIGAHGADLTDSAGSVVASLEAADPNQRLVGLLDRVPVLRVSGAYPYESRSGFFSEPEETYLQLLRRLREAARDRSVKGLVLHLDRSPFSWAQVEELRGMITELSAADRPVVVYLDEAAGNRDYYLATAADRVFLHPAAELDLTGLSAETLYYRGVLDLVGVEPQFQRRSEYKSAPETYTRHEPSGPASEQMNALLDDLYSGLVVAVAQARGLDEDQVKALIDGGPYTAAEAVELGLVDGLIYPDQLRGELDAPFPDPHYLDDEYLERLQRSGWSAPRRIAVVLITGAITGGESQPPGLFGGGNTGSETVVQALEQAREDPTVKAVVLRVDSPGGSAFASEDIHRAVSLLQDEGKPVVVSMGGVAASGGYYVSAGADAIFAEPATITGSIGVYGGKISLEGLYEKVGIGSTIWFRGRKAAMWSSSRPLDPVEDQALEHLIDATYLQFKARVAEGRAMDDDQVEALARGRVWTGVRAQQLGLVDELGGLFDAVDYARDAAGIRPKARYELVTYDSRRDALGELPRRLIRAAVGQPAPELALSQELEQLRAWSSLRDEHLFMLLPYSLEIR
jgi:protease-4